jgi:hypothetical protein
MSGLILSHGTVAFKQFCDFCNCLRPRDGLLAAVQEVFNRHLVPGSLVRADYNGYADAHPVSILELLGQFRCFSAADDF